MLLLHFVTFISTFLCSLFFAEMGGLKCIISHHINVQATGREEGLTFHFSYNELDNVDGLFLLNMLA